MKLTSMQQAAAALSPVDTCVVAGPGSGKTTVLIERYRLLVESGVPPARILAITFTEKATLHMRKHLARAFASDVDLQRQIQRAWVSTVHGFCSRLLRQYPIEAGIDPEFRVLNEAQSDRLKETTAGEALDALFAERPSDVRSLLESLAAPDIAQPLIEVQEALRAAGEPIGRLRQLNSPSRVPELSERLRSLCLSLSQARTPRWDRKHVDAASKILLWATQWFDLGAETPGLRHLRHLSDLQVNLTTIPNGPGRDAVRTLRDEVVKEMLSELASEIFAGCRSTLMDAFEHFDSLYRARKRSMGALDFTDLEEHTVALLQSEPAIRERIRNQFDQILMDEFQDTNGVQANLLSLIRPENRFYAVGDINQSIYGFRHADPDVFRRYRSAAGNVAELRENWRTRSPILSAVSTILEGASGIEPHRFVPARGFSGKDLPSVELIAAIGPAAADALEIEASCVAARIAELAGTLQLEKGLARFGDIALLFRSTSFMDVFADALERSGIPFVIRAGRGFYEGREITDLIHYLRVLANPRDEISLAAVLRSPFFGVSDEVLLEMRRGGPLADGLSRIPAAQQTIANDRSRIRGAGVERVLVEAIDRCGFESRLSARQRGNVEKFIVRLREFLETRSLLEFIDEVDHLRASDPREPESEVDDSENAVVLQTIHSAKGLEFPIVFLPALHTGVAADREAIRFAPGLGLAVRWRDPVSAAAAPDALFKPVSDYRKQRESEEADRLLYVAMTRAEEHLVLSYSMGGSSPEGWAKRVSEQLAVDLKTPGGPRVESVAPLDGDPFDVRIQVVTRPTALTHLAPQVREPLSAAAFVSKPALTGQHDSAASVTSVALFHDCPRRYYLSRYLSWRPALGAAYVDVEPADLDSPDASAVGRQVHALLAGWNVEATDEAHALAARFRESSLGRKAAETLLVEREYSFVFSVGGVVLTGQIDLWFEHSGELIVVDYKTDEVSSDQAQEHARIHELQLRLYALALERMHGRPPDGAFVHLLRPNMIIPVTPDASAAERAVNAFREAQESMDFPLRPGAHCLRCPHFRGACPVVLEN